MAGTDEASLEKFGVKATGIKKRIAGMISGNKEIAKKFKFMSENSIRGFLEA